MSHLFGGSGFLGLGRILGPIAEGVLGLGAGVLLGPEVGGLLGLTGTVADVAGGGLVGAGLGAAEGGLTPGGNPLTGALLGGATGAAGAGISDVVGDLFGGTGVSSTPGLDAPAVSPTGAVVGSASPGGVVGAASTSPDFSVSGGSPSITDLTSGPSAAAQLGATSGLSTTPASLADTTTGFAAPISGPGGANNLFSGSPITGAGNDNSIFVGGLNDQPAGAVSPTSGAGLSTPAGTAPAGDVGVIDPAFATGSFPAAPSGFAPGVDPSATFTPGGTTQGAFGGLFGSTPDPTGGTLNTSALGPTSSASGLTINTAAPAAPAASGGVLGSGSGFLGLTPGQELSGGLAGAGLLYNLTRQNSIPGESALTGEAATLGNESTQLQNYVATGTLPPGVNTVLKGVQQGLIDQIKAKYAQLGMSGSTGEQQDINNAVLQVQSQGATEALNLMNQGVSLANLSGQLLTTLLNTNVQQNNQTVQSVGQLAAALAGPTSVTLKAAA
jgi:hypothetical protein